MSVSHLRYRKGVYYVRVRVPKDLKHIIQRDELNHSLKTSDKTIAKLLAKDYLFQLNRKFVLLRTGFLDCDQKQQVIVKIAKPKAVQEPATSTFSISMLIDDYVKANHQKWRAKSRMEVEYSIYLAMEVMGDIEVDQLTRDRLKEYKAILMKLPANFNRSPKYKGMSIAKIVATEGIKPMSVTSVNKHLSWLGSADLCRQGRLYTDQSGHRSPSATEHQS